MSPRFLVSVLILLLGLTALPADDSIVLNGNLSEPINIDRKRGKWNLLGTVGNAPFDMIASGFTQENGELTIDLSQLGMADGKKPTFVQFSQLITPLTPGVRYRSSFEAKATPAGECEFVTGIGVVVNGQMEGGLPWQTEKPSGEWREISYEFTAAELPPDAKAVGSRFDIRIPKPETGVIAVRNFQLTEIP